VSIFSTPGAARNDSCRCGLVPMLSAFAVFRVILGHFK
jgi:hypothetical protein